MSNRCKPEYRSLLAAVIKSEPKAKEMFRMLRNLGAQNMRCDYRLDRDPRTGLYERGVDPEVWYAECRNGIFVAMIRHGENDWTLHS